MDVGIGGGTGISPFTQKKVEAEKVIPEKIICYFEDIHHFFLWF